MRERILEYIGITFKERQSDKILVYDNYSEKFLIRYNILKYNETGEEFGKHRVVLGDDIFCSKNGIIGCENISNLINRTISFDVIYVLEQAHTGEIVNRNKHLGNIYINYFNKINGDNHEINKEHINRIIIDKFIIIGNVILLDDDISLIEILKVLNIPFMIYYDNDIQQIPVIENSNTLNVLTMVKRENNNLTIFKFRSRLIDYVFDCIDDPIICEILGNSYANNLLKEIWVKPIMEAHESLKFKFLQFKENNSLAKFELKKISINELDKNTLSNIVKNIGNYNDIKIGYKLVFLLVSKCIEIYNTIPETKFSLFDLNKNWNEIYTNIKPIIEDCINNEINFTNELYKIFHIMNHHKQNWSKLAIKLGNKYNLKFDKNKLPSNIITRSNTIIMKTLGSQNTEFPKSIKSYRFPRFNAPQPINAFYIDKGLCSGDVVDPNIYYIGIKTMK